VKIINPNFEAPAPVTKPKVADVQAAIAEALAARPDVQSIEAEGLRQVLGFDQAQLPDADLSAACTALDLEVKP